MTAISYKKGDLEKLAPLKRAYLGDTAAPIDGMWEIFADMADHYEICQDGKTIGYFSVSDEKKLMQLYMPHMTHKRAFLQSIIEDLQIKGAFVSTAEPEYLSLCLDQQKSVAVNALMYQASDSDRMPEPVFPDGCSFRLVSLSEHETAVAFGLRAFEAEEGWLREYYHGHIAREQLYGLWSGGAMIAAGELRRSASQKPYGDVGMVVARQHRSSGIATNILIKLRRLARENGLTAICSTEADNIAAQKAITNAGFVSRHRVLDICF